MNRDSETMKERSIFDILNESFAAFGKGFREYVLISLMVFAPANLITFLGPRTSLQQYVSDGSIPGSAVIFYIAVAIVTLVSTTAVWSASSVATGQQMLTGNINIKDCFQRVSWRIYSLFFLSFVLTICLALGLIGIALIIPAVASLAFLLMASFALPVALYEGKKYTSALIRSFQLVKVDWVRILGAMSLIVLIMLGITVLISTPTLFMASPVAGGVSMLALVIQYFLSLVANTVAVVISAVAVTLIYFDTRVRIEGFDEGQLSSEIGYQT